jgi:hypothetical protein
MDLSARSPTTVISPPPRLRASPTPGASELISSLRRRCPDLHDYALNARERAATDGDAVAMRMIFVAKEAVYKAINPLDGSAPEYEDIDVDLSVGRALLRDGRALDLLLYRGAFLLAVAIFGPVGA